jgi:outer membrane lipoprotein-sorting protein
MRINNLSFLVILFSISSFVWAQDSLPVSAKGNEILKKVDEVLTPGSMEFYRKLINEEPNGDKKEFIFYSVKKDRDKVAMLYLAPASEKGRATLRLGDNMWLYIPNVGKPIRITSMQSIVGGVFNNADIMRLDYSAEYDAVNLKEEGGGYILDLKAKTRTVSYDSLKMWVIKKNNIVEKVECYAASGKLIKTLDFKQVKNFGGGIVRPAVIETTSPLYKGYKSVMIYSKIKRKKFPDEVFTLDYLSRLGELR